MLANDGPVRQRLESVASEVSKAVDKELQASPGERVQALSRGLGLPGEITGARRKCRAETTRIPTVQRHY